MCNPRCACTARVIVLGFDIVFVCYRHRPQEVGQRAIVNGSLLHWLDFFLTVLRTKVIVEPSDMPIC